MSTHKEFKSCPSLKNVVALYRSISDRGTTFFLSPMIRRICLIRMGPSMLKNLPPCVGFVSKKLREHLDDVPLFCDLLEHYLEILNAVAIKQYTGRLMKLSLMSISKPTPTDSLGDPSKYIRTNRGETFVSLLNLVSIKPFETSSSRASACLLRSHRLLWLLCLRLHLCRGPRLILCDWRHLGFRPGPGSWCGRHLHH